MRSVREAGPRLILLSVAVPVQYLVLDDGLGYTCIKFSFKICVESSVLDISSSHIRDLDTTTTVLVIETFSLNSYYAIQITIIEGCLLYLHFHIDPKIAVQASTLKTNHYKNVIILV